MIAMARFRTSCHSLAIETGRYTIPPTPPEHHLCTYCTSGRVDDELHFITECCHLDNYRKSPYNTAVQYNAEFNSLSNMRKMCYLFETNNTPAIRKLGWYMFSCFEFRKSACSTLIFRAGGDGGAGRAFALPLFGGPYRK